MLLNYAIGKKGYYETYACWVRIFFKGAFYCRIFCYHLIYIHILKNRDLANSHFNIVVFYFLLHLLELQYYRPALILPPCEVYGVPSIKGE